MSANTTEETKTEAILRLHKEVKVKNSLYKYLSSVLGVATSTVRINWFFNEDFPEGKQDSIIKHMEEFINEKP